MDLTVDLKADDEVSLATISGKVNISLNNAGSVLASALLKPIINVVAVENFYLAIGKLKFAIVFDIRLPNVVVTAF
jgi:hypothetical protein